MLGIRTFGGASFLSHEVAKAHQRRAGGVSDANDGRHPLERSGSIRIQKISGVNVANFTVATNLAYRDKDGSPIIETTWHNVTAWESKEIHNLDKIEKGCKVHLVGRIRNQRFTGADGVD